MNFSVKEQEKDAINVKHKCKEKGKGCCLLSISLTCPTVADSTAQEYIL